MDIFANTQLKAYYHFKPQSVQGIKALPYPAIIKVAVVGKVSHAFELHAQKPFFMGPFEWEGHHLACESAHFQDIFIQKSKTMKPMIPTPVRSFGKPYPAGFSFLVQASDSHGSWNPGHNVRLNFEIAAYPNLADVCGMVVRRSVILAELFGVRLLANKIKSFEKQRIAVQNHLVQPMETAYYAQLGLLNLYLGYLLRDGGPCDVLNEIKHAIGSQALDGETQEIVSIDALSAWSYSFLAGTVGMDFRSVALMPQIGHWFYLLEEAGLRELVDAYVGSSADAGLPAVGNLLKMELARFGRHIEHTQVERRPEAAYLQLIRAGYVDGLKFQKGITPCSVELADVLRAELRGTFPECSGPAD